MIVPKAQNRKLRIRVTISHKTILNTIPPIPSATSNPDSIGLKSEGTISFKKAVFLVFILSVIFPIVSFNLIPLYKPIVIKRKKIMDRKEVDINEFSITVLCLPIP